MWCLGAWGKYADSAVFTAEMAFPTVLHCISVCLHTIKCVLQFPKPTMWGFIGGVSAVLTVWPDWASAIWMLWPVLNKQKCLTASEVHRKTDPPITGSHCVLIFSHFKNNSYFSESIWYKDLKDNVPRCLTCKYTKTASVKVSHRPNICYIFEMVMVRGPQKQWFRVCDMKIANTEVVSSFFPPALLESKTQTTLLQS